MKTVCRRRSGPAEAPRRAVCGQRLPGQRRRRRPVRRRRWSTAGTPTRSKRRRPVPSSSRTGGPRSRRSNSTAHAGAAPLRRRPRSSGYGPRGHPRRHRRAACCRTRSRATATVSPPCCMTCRVWVNGDEVDPATALRRRRRGRRAAAGVGRLMANRSAHPRRKRLQEASSRKTTQEAGPEPNRRRPERRRCGSSTTSTGPASVSASGGSSLSLLALIGRPLDRRAPVLASRPAVAALQTAKTWRHVRRDPHRVTAGVGAGAIGMAGAVTTGLVGAAILGDRRRRLVRRLQRACSQPARSIPSSTRRTRSVARSFRASPPRASRSARASSSVLSSGWCSSSLRTRPATTSSARARAIRSKDRSPARPRSS